MPPRNRSGVALGLSLALTALIFWKLDERSSFLIKHAEAALKKIESDTLADHARLFDAESDKTTDQQMIAKGLTSVWTYGKAFRTIFALAALVGLGGSALALVLYCTEPARQLGDVRSATKAAELRTSD